MIRDGIWGVFSLPYTHNKEKEWDILLRQYQFPLDYRKPYVKTLNKSYKADHYVVRNLACSGVYLIFLLIILMVRPL